MFYFVPESPSPFSDSVICLPDSPSYSVCLHTVQCTMAASVLLPLSVDINVQYIHLNKQTKKNLFFSNQVILVSRYIVSSSIYRMP